MLMNKYINIKKYKYKIKLLLQLQKEIETVHVGQVPTVYSLLTKDYLIQCCLGILFC